MDHLALLSNELIASLTTAQQVAHRRGIGSELRALVRQARELHATMARRMAAAPQSVSQNLRSFATLVDTVLSSLECAIVRADGRLN